MNQGDLSTNARKRVLVFVVSAIVIAVTGILEQRRYITAPTQEYINSVTWLAMFAVVVSAFRRLHIRSNYLQKVFVGFSVFLLVEVLLDLPIIQLVCHADTSPVWPYLTIFATAGWTAACAMVLHGLCLSIQAVEQESSGKENALKKVKESERRWMAMFETAEDNVFYKDASSRYVHVNQSMERLFGMSRSQIIGKGDEELFGIAGAKDVQAEDVRVLQGETIDVESTKSVNGAMRTFHVIKAPIRDDEDNIIGLFGIARDTTARRDAEANLRLTQFSLDWAVDVVLWVNQRSQITYANEAARKLLGPSVASRTMADIDAQWDGIRVARNLGFGTTYETEYRTAFDELVSVEASAIRFSHQATDLTCVFARDISDRKRLQAENQQRLSDLSHLSRIHIAGEMVAGLAHELNQPLESICNYSYIIAKTLASNEVSPLTKAQLQSLQQKSETTRGESLRAGNIIHRLRSLVNKRPPLRVETDLNHLVVETIELFDSQWPGSYNPVVVELAQGSLRLVVDAIQIQQVLLNLLTNAKDAVRGQGTAASITVRTSRSANNEEVSIAVEDNGEGFAEFGEENLFQPFASSKRDGMGLGLAISRTIASAHGGDLSADHAPNGGAILSLHLPVQVPEKKNELQSIRC